MRVIALKIIAIAIEQDEAGQVVRQATSDPVTVYESEFSDRTLDSIVQRFGMKSDE